MDDSNRAAKQKLMEAADARLLSPERRSEIVYAILREHAPQLTNWDIICFAVNYLGYAAMNIAWLKLPAKHIARLVYTAHYMDEATDNATGLADKGASRETPPSHQPPDTDPVREPQGVSSEFDVPRGRFE